MTNLEKYQKLLLRVASDSTKYSKDISPYSQALLNCIQTAELNVDDFGWLRIGDVYAEFLRIKNIKIKPSTKSEIYYINLDSWDKPCLSYRVKSL